MIRITGIKVGKHSIPVPPGLSELVNQASAWRLPVKNDNDDYHREVVMLNGELTTILTKKESKIVSKKVVNK